MNPKNIAEIVMELSILPFFPSEDFARLAIVRMVGEMAHTEDQVRWLVRVMTSGAFSKWEGPAELRAVFCMKYKPKDGIEGASAFYPEGMTAEQLNPGVKQIAVPPVRQLPAGEPASEDRELATLVDSTAARVTNLRFSMRNIHVPAPRPEETEYTALQRVVDDSRTEVVYSSDDPLAGVKPASAAEIELLKMEQDRNRKLTRVIEAPTA